MACIFYEKWRNSIAIAMTYSRMMWKILLGNFWFNIMILPSLKEIKSMCRPLFVGEGRTKCITSGRELISVSQRTWLYSIDYLWPLTWPLPQWSATWGKSQVLIVPYHGSLRTEYFWEERQRSPSFLQWECYPDVLWKVSRGACRTVPMTLQCSLVVSNVQSWESTPVL